MLRSIPLRFLFIIGALLCLSSTALSQDNLREFQSYPQSLATPVHFTYSLDLAEDAAWQWVAASHDTQTPTGPIPEYTEIRFQNYHNELGWQDTGQFIYLYPRLSFPSEANYPFSQELNQLEQLLAEHPSTIDETVPMLPIVTASQLFRAQFEYIETENLSGIRYLTVATLDVSPVSNQVLFYSFQGLTKDGAYYIAALFPVSSPSLPDIAPSMTTEEYNDFATNFDSYLQETVSALEALTPQDFSPSLSLIDDVFRSMEVSSPTATFLSTPDSQTSTVSYEEMNFTYNSSLASRLELRDIPAYVDNETMSMFGSEPTYRLFHFFDYPVTQVFRPAELYFIPVDSFPMTNTISDNRLVELRNFLAERPSMSAQSNLQGLASIPILPIVNAAQVFVAKPEYLEFENGYGIRFLSFYSQGIEPVTNGSLAYLFIGMSFDERYIISGYFPVATDILPDDYDYQSLDYDAFAENYPQYIEDTALSLDAAENFSPNLSDLDNLIRSIRTTE